jgi:hypothetical protein
VSVWAEVFLGIIALATLATAIGQVGLLLAAGRAFKRVERLADHVEQDLKPLFGYIDAIGRDASRAASLATVQVERADRLMADLTARIEQILSIVHSVVGNSAREGTALLAGFRAALTALREMRERRARSRAEDEDALFI